MKKRKTRKLLRELREKDRKEIERIISKSTLLPESLRSLQKGAEKFLGLLREDEKFFEGEIIVDPYSFSAYKLGENLDVNRDKFIKYSNKWDMPEGRVHARCGGPGWSCGINKQNCEYTRLATSMEIEKLDKESEYYVPLSYDQVMRLGKYDKEEYILNWHDCLYRYHRETKELLRDDDESNKIPWSEMLVSPSIKQFERAVRREGIYFKVEWFTRVEKGVKIKYSITQYKNKWEYEIFGDGKKNSYQTALEDSIDKIIDILVKEK